MNSLWIGIISFGFMIYLLIKLVDIERKHIEKEQRIIKYLKELEAGKQEALNKKNRKRILKQLDDAEV